MFADITHLLELRRVPARTGRRPVSTLAFDWLYVALMLLFNVGVSLDVWSHGQFGPDQSVFSEYHMLFYTAIGMMGLLLFGTHQMNLRAGYSWANALPIGYGITLLGVLLFGFAGVFDLIGHALWGFEAGIEALYSPSHFTLFLSGALIRVGPIIAVITRSKQTEIRSLWGWLPGLICFASFTATVSVFALGYAPLGGRPFAMEAFRPLEDNQGYMLGIAGAFVQTAVVFGLLMWLMREVRLPFGAITLVFSMMAILTVFRAGGFAMPILITAGLLTDSLYQVVKPNALSRVRMMAFGFIAPLILWYTYYGLIILTGAGGGTYFTPYLWIGSTLQTGIVGMALGYLMTLHAPSTPKEAKS